MIRRLSTRDALGVVVEVLAPLLARGAILRRPTLRILANLSAASLNDESLLSYIEDRLRATRLEPGRLSFEITESAAVADFASARNWIRRLKELGCLFALDDFGVGFSSLGYLRALAVDYVKIDRTFIRDVDTNLTNRALVQAVNTVAHTLGKALRQSARWPRLASMMKLPTTTSELSTSLRSSTALTSSDKRVFASCMLTVIMLTKLV